MGVREFAVNSTMILSLPMCFRCSIDCAMDEAIDSSESDNNSNRLFCFASSSMDSTFLSLLSMQT